MTEKHLSEEAEQRISSIKTSKARSDILVSLERSYYKEIEENFDPKISECSTKINDYKVPNQKADVEKFVAAIKAAAGKKYCLQYDVVCKIADGNTLTFVLVPNMDEVADIVATKKTSEKLSSSKYALIKKLASWKRKQMFNIANGLDFDEFEIKLDAEVKK
jgi:hypothetical protein